MNLARLNGWQELERKSSELEDTLMAAYHEETIPVDNLAALPAPVPQQQRRPVVITNLADLPPGAVPLGRYAFVGGLLFLILVRVGAVLLELAAGIPVK